MMIDNLQKKRTERVMKLIPLSKEERNKHILYIMKRQRILKDSEWTYITVQTMYFKL